MKTAIALALALSVIPAATQPVSAEDILDLVRKNCSKELVAVTEVTRNELKDFTIVKAGSGYLMSGKVSSGRILKCKTNSTGRVIESSFA